jgi:hypothetical protein
MSECCARKDGSPMALDDFRDNGEPHAQAGDGFLPGTGGPIEALKDFVALLSRDTDAMIADTDGDRLRRGALPSWNCKVSPPTVGARCTCSQLWVTGETYSTSINARVCFVLRTAW